MSNINMGMNIGMTMDMGMTFHSKQTNLLRPKQTRATLKISDGIVDAKLMFQSPMIDRVVKAKSGCSACGR
jgi:hypothetical protein